MLDAGVTVIPGPDGGIGPHKTHDVLPGGVIKLAEIMPPIDVLRGVTKVAAQACTLGNRKGRLLPGYDADALVVAGDPVGDIRRLNQPLAVFHGGHRVR